MNRKLLLRILELLNEENVRLDYVRGILETMIEGLPEDKVISTPIITPTKSSPSIDGIPPLSASRIKEIEEITKKSKEL